ncbi:MAG: efflux RND transporter periplasmic adaptor subunit [Gammaproteobacteria bacterium]|nr:efflux RND transporter periplasmic adaptor subunit [Gammaproteobacteria bacterium]
MNQKFSQLWLATLCSFIPGIHSAVFMVPDRGNNSIRTVAKLPASLGQINDFISIVKYTLKSREHGYFPNARTIGDQAYDFFSLPVLMQSKIFGILIIKVKHLPESRHAAVFNSLKRGVKWLRLGNVTSTQGDNFYTSVVGLLAACFEQGSYQQGLISMVTELTREFNCERVAFAEFRHHHCYVVALSNSSGFDDRSNLVRKIADAMDEAVEQDSAMVFPDPDAKQIQRAHKDLARKFGAGSLCSIPLIHDQKVFGAVTLLRSEEMPFDSETLDLCQQALSLITPFLALKHDDEKSLIRKIGVRLKKRLGNFFGFKNLGLKLFAITAVIVLSLAVLIESEFRVSADAILEGKIQRVVAAPISGYLLSASVRAGDTVRKGDVMASLDDAELKLELTKNSGQLQKARREYRQAQSERDLVNIRVIREQINQTKAEIALTRQQLANIRLIAPFDGVVIEGDLSQLLGSPVERGDTLFKIAPLEGYRIILKVDESDISFISQGQTGTLVLSSLSDHSLPLTVEKITTVAKADDGANIFRVEASLNNAPDLLRPGMEGVGKVNVGRARMIWIWTHEITDWLQLWVWSWWP